MNYIYLRLLVPLHARFNRAAKYVQVTRMHTRVSNMLGQQLLGVLCGQYDLLLQGNTMEAFRADPLEMVQQHLGQPNLKRKDGESETSGPKSIESRNWLERLVVATSQFLFSNSGNPTSASKRIARVCWDSRCLRCACKWILRRASTLQT